MKRWIAMMLALMMAFALTACSPNTGETEKDKTPEEPLTQGEDSAGREEEPSQGERPSQEEESSQGEKPSQEEELSQEEKPSQGEELSQGEEPSQKEERSQKEEEDRPLYIFVHGQLVGSWENGQWVSAVSEEGGHPFTMGEILAEDHYWTYQNDGTNGYLMQCEFSTYHYGLGGFMDEARDTAALLDPYAVYVPEEEWEQRTFALPTTLEGEAAELLVPNYSFVVSFGGSFPDLALSQPLSSPIYFGDEVKEYHPDIGQWQEIAETTLEKMGIDEDFFLSGVAYTGQEREAVLAVNSARNQYGFWQEDNKQVFSLVLWIRSDGTVETVYRNVERYTDDATMSFRIMLQSVCDLNGDGQMEVCLRDSRWEWGQYYVMARDENGTWQRVLQADYGM